jgi:MFS family permease
VWGILQLGTGWLSDPVGRKPLITLGMFVQAGGLGLLLAGGGAFAPALAAAALLGLGTALVYPTLIAAVSDLSEPRDRAVLVGVYRFWRDTGYVVGALLIGFGADTLGSGAAIAIVAALTGLSGLVVAATAWDDRPSPGTMGGISNFPLADERLGRRLRLEPADDEEDRSWQTTTKS